MAAQELVHSRSDASALRDQRPAMGERQLFDFIGCVRPPRLLVLINQTIASVHTPGELLPIFY